MQVLYWSSFSCLQMYSEKIFNAYFYEQMLLEIFVAKVHTGQFFWEIMAYTVKFSFFISGCSFNILVDNYFSEKWEQIYQFGFKSKTTEGNSAAIYFW